MKKRNVKEGKFYNLEDTPMMAKNTNYFSVISKALNKSKNTVPKNKIPSVKTDLKKFYSETPVIFWFGHSSYLIHCKGVNILVDPVFSGRVSPIPGMLKAFPGSNVYKVEDMPELDVVIITHNHYDHLDYKTIKKLNNITRTFYTPLGVRKDVERAGVKPSKIDEMNWGNSIKILKKIKLRAVPARHFSGRGLIRNTSLWAAFVLEIYDWKIFIGGDSGYGKHFTTIGEEHGPFDIALLECGQYDKNWPYIHMQPEETLKAASDLKAKTLLPVHWAKFALANHPWNEPINRLVESAKDSTVNLAAPKIGQPVYVEKQLPIEKWWKI